MLATELTKVGYEKDHDWMIDGCRGPNEGEVVKMPTFAK
jgi:gamma-glutamyltranspeptidase/glutathione hydrolase